MSQWYCYVRGQQYGPVSEPELRDWARAGRVTPTDHVWMDGWANWQPASTVPGLFPTGAAWTAYARPHRGAAVLVLGILGLTAGCVVGTVCAIIAWVMGRADLREMAAGRMDRSGEGMTRAGMICGIIAVILHVVAAVILVGWVAVQISGMSP